MTMHQELILNKISSVLQATDDSLVDKIVSSVDKAKRIFITGAGRSGLVSRFFAMRLMHSGYTVYMVGEIVTPSIQAGDLFIVISGSGGTETLLPLVRKAKSMGAQIAVISMKSQSPMAEMADLVCPIGSGNENSFGIVKGMPMGTVFELSTLVFLEAIVSKIVHDKGLTEEGMRALHANLE
ncbi:6-phospho-3-hexuloisomerase [Novimethylophilus kurashikiensis]|nr:6-phospho-3-hexuloisomerase [Novimethylophilus kurashikiensis]